MFFCTGNMVTIVPVWHGIVISIMEEEEGEEKGGHLMAYTRTDTIASVTINSIGKSTVMQRIT